MEEIREYDISKCPKIPLTDLVEYIVDNRGKTVPTTNEGIKLIATNCIRNEYLYPLYEKVRYVSQQIYDTWFRAHPKPGDIIFVNKGGPGKTALVPDNLDFCIAQDMMAFHVKSDVIYNKYLLAVLRGRPIQQFILNSQVGTIIPHFKKEQLKSLLIPLPDMTIQKRIGDFYFNNSEKCENNRKINENLEQQAQALFKSWFIDFEPFKDGKFIDSELGPIPEGWRVMSLSDIANYLNGLAMQKYRPNNGEKGLPVLKIKELGAGQCDSNSDLCSSSINEDYIVNDGDVIFSWSGTLLVDIWCGGKCGLNQHLFKVTSSKYPKWFYYLWTLHHLSRFINIAKDKAVTMGHIKRGELDTSLVCIPPENEMENATSLIEPYIKNIISIRVENRKLASLRDALLPKLMSGEIEV